MSFSPPPSQPSFPEFRPVIPEKRPLGAAKALGVFLVYLGTQILVGFLVVAGYSMATGALIGPDELDSALLLLAGAAGILVGGVVVFGVTRSLMPGRTLSEAMAPLGWVKPPPGSNLKAAGSGLALALFFMFVVQLVVPPEEAAEGPLIQAASASGWTQIIFVVLAIVLAPLVEEFLFRGVMFTGISRSWGAGRAGVVVTVLFGLLHITEVAGYWPSLVVVTIAGIAMLRVRIKSGSLLPAIALHATYNAVQVVAVLLVAN